MCSRSVRSVVPLLALLPLSMGAQAAPRDSAPLLTLGVFVDGYYAWDRNRPVPRERSLTTTAVRHDEFAVNLAHVSLDVAHARVRGRFTAQTGTSVWSNYAPETVEGVASGPTLARTMQEAYVGVRAAESLWIDGGIFFSPIGFESWISLDNPTYTRSLTADYTPYYLSGVRATWQPSATVTTTVQLVNGWQRMSENNDGKALVARVDWAASPRLALGASAFVGDEQPRGAGARLRQFGQLLLRATPRDGTEGWVTIDGGTEAGRGAPARRWWSVTAIGRQRLTDAVSLSARVERYGDPRGVVLSLGDGLGGPMLTGGSTGVDVRLPGGALWRSEVRVLRADQRLFPARPGAQPTRDDVVVTTSLALRAERRVP